MEVGIRDAQECDMEAVASIYSHFVRGSTCTFELEPPGAPAMHARFLKVKALGSPFLVADSQSQVIGFACAGAYRERPAYRHTLENSVYVAPQAHGRGVGKQLLEQLVRCATRRHFLQMVAVVGDSRNTASIRLHERVGFSTVGVLKDVGFKHGRWLDTVLMQRTLC